MEKVIHDAETGEVTVVPFTAEEEALFWERRTPRAWSNLRSERDDLLIQSDAYVLPDRWAGYTPEQQAAWSAYRQALRDLPETTEDPFNPAWPSKPE